VALGEEQAVAVGIVGALRVHAQPVAVERHEQVDAADRTLQMALLAVEGHLQAGGADGAGLFFHFLQVRHAGYVQKDGRKPYHPRRGGASR
jgi:hypothetical protein